MARIWEHIRGRFRRFALTLPIMLAVLGPGIITGNVDNDAGGITTYSVIGARFGYSMLWMLLLITFTLAMIQEMCARMGVVTGKGLADLIRERFGIRLTMVVMVLLVFTNLANTMGEFAGVAGASSILGLNRLVAIPGVAFSVWLLVVKGSYRAVEKVLLVFCVLYLTYVISAFMARPDWGVVARSAVVPSFQMDPEFISLFIAMIGTTIAPWMQFYQQSSVAEKAIDLRTLQVRSTGYIHRQFSHQLRVLLHRCRMREYAVCSGRTSQYCSGSGRRAGTTSRKVRVGSLCCRIDERLDHGCRSPSTLDGLLRGRSIRMGVRGREIISPSPSLLWSVYRSHRSWRGTDHVCTREQAHRRHAVFPGCKRCPASTDTRPDAEAGQRQVIDG